MDVDDRKKLFHDPPVNLMPVNLDRLVNAREERLWSHNDRVFNPDEVGIVPEPLALVPL